MAELKVEDFNFLGEILEFVQKVRTSENSLLEIQKAAAALSVRFKTCQQVIQQLPGINSSEEEQLRIYNELKILFEAKQKLAEEYKSLPLFTSSEQYRVQKPFSSEDTTMSEADP
eukprot:Colp12_sorted_trinity150504_noHs@26234